MSLATYFVITLNFGGCKTSLLVANASGFVVSVSTFASCSCLLSVSLFANSHTRSVSLVPPLMAEGGRSYHIC